MHTEESEGQIRQRLDKSWWERLGFKDKKKEERNLLEAKDKVDRVFRQLRDTV